MRHLSKLVSAIIVFGIFTFNGTTQAQKAPSVGEIKGIPWIGEAGSGKSTAEIMALDKALGPQRSLERETELEKIPPDRHNLPLNPASPQVAQLPAMPDGNQQKNNEREILFSPQTVSINFTGATLSGINPTFSFPPDNMGAVGPTQYIVAVNGRIVTFNKSTGVADGVLNADIDVFFNSVRNSISTSDPRIRYDRLSGRWFVLIINVASSNNRVLIAVSNGGTITPSTVWTYFYFAQNTPPPAGDNGYFSDYPTLGVDVNALYIGVNQFNGNSYAGTTAFVVRKSSILGAGPIVVTAFRNLTGSPSGAGPYTPQGVDNFDAAATQGYFIGVDNATFGTLMLRRVSDPGGSPTMSANISLTVSSTTYPATVPHLGNTGGANGQLSALDDRLFAAVIRNGRLWTAHNIHVTNTGVAGGTTTRDAARWYEIQNLGTTPSVVQSGTVFDSTAPNDANQRNYWIPTLMITGQGHAALGFSVAGTNERINAGTVGRLSTDALGTMQTPVLYTSSSTAYNPSSDPGGSNGRRWGDYSYTSVDPNDDMTLWTIQQFCDATNSYGCRVAKLLAPPPATPTSANPDTIADTQPSVNVVITGTSVSGSGFFDPGIGFTNHLNVTISGGVIINSFTYDSPTQISLNISTVGVPQGLKDVTITNPDGQNVTATGFLYIASSAPPEFAAAPPSISFGNVIVGSPKQDSVAVTNTGGGLLHLSSVTSSNGLFTISPTVDSVFSLATKQFHVTFAPTSPGPQSAEIVFTHDGSTSPDTITVGGIGVVPINVVKLNDSDGNPSTTGDQSLKTWHLSIYKDSVSVGTLMAEADTNKLTALVSESGTYIATEADSGTSWVRVNGNTTRYDTFAVATTAVSDTFINFQPNSITVRKFEDGDGDFTTTGDRTSKPWYLEVRQGSLGGPVIASGSSGSVTASGLGAGTYYAVEADSAGWIHLGHLIDVTPTASSSNSTAVTVADGQNKIVDFINASPTFGKLYRTAKMEDWATAVDGKGKSKSIKKKADKVEFKFKLIAPASAKVMVTFSMNATGAITKGTAKAETLKTFINSKTVTTLAVVNLGDAIQLDGFGLKGKAIKVKYEWLTSPKSTKGEVTLFGTNMPRFPMPNLHNVGEELYGQSVFPTGLLVGIPQGVKGANSVIHPKYKDVQKSMYSKSAQHTGGARCLDEFDTNHKPIDKQQKSLPREKHNNKLFAEVLALKLNIAASEFGKFPEGLGQLTYFDNSDPGNLLNGQLVDTIVVKADRVLSCLVDVSKGDTLQPDDLYPVIRNINIAFAGAVDTSSFGSKTELKGVKPVIDVPYLHPTPGIAPKTILASGTYREPVPAGFVLAQNYPNPFNPTTMIQFELPTSAVVTLKVFNALGQEVATLIDRELMDEGTREAEFNANSFSSGLYFYRLAVEPVTDDEGNLAGHSFVSVKKMVLLK